MRGLGTMGMSAMLVVDMNLIAMRRMLASRRMAMRGSCVRMRVIVKCVIARVMQVMPMIVMMRCRMRQDRRKLWLRSAVR